MAAFTTLALLGASAAIQYFANRNKNSSTLAPGPTSTTLGGAVPRGTVGSGPTPPDASQSSALAAAQAQAANDRQRKQAQGGGSTVLTGIAGTKTPAAVTTPRTLLGY